MQPMQEVPTRPIHCVLFDVDGTLIDSENFNRTLLRETLATFGIVVADASLDALRGRTIRHCYDVLAPRIPFDDCFTAHRALELERAHTLRAFRDAQVVVPILRNHGIRLGIHTSRRRRSLLELLASTLLDIHFLPDAILGFEDVPNPKPDPEGIRRLLRRHDADARTTIYVGDTHIDVQAAHAAAVHAAAIVRDGPVPEDVHALQPAFILRDLRSLLPLCGIRA